MPQPQVTLTLSLQIDGRPLWSATRKVRPETSAQMGEQEYMKALEAAGAELTKQISAYKARDAANKP